MVPSLSSYLGLLKVGAGVLGFFPFLPPGFRDDFGERFMLACRKGSVGMRPLDRPGHQFKAFGRFRLIQPSPSMKETGASLTPHVSRSGFRQTLVHQTGK